jgi:hypothetical protein
MNRVARSSAGGAEQVEGGQQGPAAPAGSATNGSVERAREDLRAAVERHDSEANGPKAGGKEQERMTSHASPSNVTRQRWSTLRGMTRVGRGLRFAGGVPSNPGECSGSG